MMVASWTSLAPCGALWTGGAIQSASAMEVISTATATVAIEIIGYRIFASNAAVLESANIF